MLPIRAGDTAEGLAEVRLALLGLTSPPEADKLGRFFRVPAGNVSFLKKTLVAGRYTFR